MDFKMTREKELSKRESIKILNDLELINKNDQLTNLGQTLKILS